YCMANQMATGLALTIFGIGLSGLIGQGFVGETVPGLPTWSPENDLMRAIFGHDAMVYGAVIACLGVWVFLHRTRAGLSLRAVGDNPQAGHALGLGVRPIRVAAVLFGGAMAGLGGAYLSLAYTPMWGEEMTAGRGWIALALVVFATWRPERLLLGAWLFAAVTQAQFYGTELGLGLPSQILAMTPYLATILILVLISRNPSLTRKHAPAAIARAFRPER
ncbi:MAG: ABC transporter permease, partial [Pseudomonadota bacterium]